MGGLLTPVREPFSYRPSLWSLLSTTHDPIPPLVSILSFFISPRPALGQLVAPVIIPCLCDPQEMKLERC